MVPPIHHAHDERATTLPQSSVDMACKLVRANIEGVGLHTL